MSGEATSELQRVLGSDQAEISLPHPRSEYWRWSNLDLSVRKSLQGISDAPTGCKLSFSGMDANGDVQAPMLSSTKDYALYSLARAASNPDTRAAFALEEGQEARLQICVQGGTGVSGSHVSIDLAKDAKLVLIEDWQKGNGTSVHLREIRLADGAQLARIVILPEGAGETRILPAMVETGANAQYSQYVLEQGGLQSRVETQVQTNGVSANIRLNHAYLLRDECKADQTSSVVLNHEHTNVRQMVKGVVTDKAEAVFQGKFLVNRQAQQTDAKMGHHCLLLSEQGRVRAKPELEIYADDVECAHGNTTGMLDENSLFYMRQRGLPEQQARALLMRAFISEVFASLDEQDRESIDERLADWLEAAQ